MTHTGIKWHKLNLSQIKREWVETNTIFHDATMLDFGIVFFIEAIVIASSLYSSYAAVFFMGGAVLTILQDAFDFGSDLQSRRIALRYTPKDKVTFFSGTIVEYGSYFNFYKLTKAMFRLIQAGLLIWLVPAVGSLILGFFILLGIFLCDYLNRECDQVVCDFIHSIPDEQLAQE